MSFELSREFLLINLIAFTLPSIFSKLVQIDAVFVFIFSKLVEIDFVFALLFLST